MSEKGKKIQQENMAKIGVKTSSESVNILIFMHSIKKVIIGLTVQKIGKCKRKISQQRP